MILFDNKATNPAYVLSDTLGYVNDVIISNDRVTMRTTVTLSPLSQAPDYAAYASWECNEIPFDYESKSSPSAQCYTWLMANDPRFSGGVQYPSNV